MQRMRLTTHGPLNTSDGHLIDTVNALSMDIEQVIEKIALGQVRVLDKGRGQVVSLKDIRKIWKRAE